jgi:hypothetical protein
MRDNYREIYLASIVIAADLALALDRSRRQLFFPRRKLSEARDLLPVLAAVFSLQRKKPEPPTATTIARHVKMARATLLRKLAVLKDEGWVQQDGKRYRANEDRLSDPDYVRAFRRNQRLIRWTAKKLSEMDILD